MSDEAKSVIKGHCPTCDGERHCSVHGFIEKHWHWHDDRLGDYMHGEIEHSLLECKGCETVFYQKSSWNSENMDMFHDHMGNLQGEQLKDVTTFPKPETKSTPRWLDQITEVDAQLHRILSEVYIAVENKAFILSAVGLRTAFDRATEVLQIAPSKTFKEKLDDLKEKGFVGTDEYKGLEIVVDAGSAAAHRGWELRERELAHLISAMEIFIQRAFILRDKVTGVEPRIPERPKKGRSSTNKKPADPSS